MEFSTFIGPPTVVLAVWVCFLAGWPWEGVLVLGAYIGFNLVWSLLEARRLPITRGSHPRAIANFVFMFGIFASLAHTDGAWIMALPTMFGSQGSPTMRQARYVRILALLGIALGSFTAGIPAFGNRLKAGKTGGQQPHLPAAKAAAPRVLGHRPARPRPQQSFDAKVS